MGIHRDTSRDGGMERKVETTIVFGVWGFGFLWRA